MNENHVAPAPDAVKNLSPECARALARGGRIFVWESDELLLVQEGCDAVRAQLMQAGFSQRSVFTVSGAHYPWQDVIGATQSMSLFGDKELIELRLPSGKPGVQGAPIIEQLVRAVAQEDSLALLLTLPQLDKKSRDSAWCASAIAAAQSGGAYLSIKPIAYREMPQWIAQRLRAQGQAVEAGEAGERSLEWMRNRLEGNLLAAQQEIIKLGLLYPQRALSYDEITASVASVARYDMDKLAEAIWSGQSRRALRILAGLRAEGEAAVPLHWSIAEDIRNVHKVCAALASGQPLPMAMTKIRVWGIKQRGIETLAPRLTLAQSAQLIEAARICDGVIKGLPHPDWLPDAWHALARLILMLCAKIRKP